MILFSIKRLKALVSKKQRKKKRKLIDANWNVERIFQNNPFYYFSVPYGLQQCS